MRFLDTNVILCYLMADDERKAADRRTLLERASAGQEAIVTYEAVIAEVVYVLSSRAHYALSHADVTARLRPIHALRGLHIANNQRIHAR